jgi:hypothetical protein
MTQHYIYRPRSGDRVFIEQPSDWLAITTWGNGCRTVEGDIVALTWSTATPTKHWRGLAVRALTDMITAIREGCAYDAQGEVTAIVTTRYAGRVRDLMNRIRPHADGVEDGLNAAALYRASAACITVERESHSNRVNPYSLQICCEGYGDPQVVTVSDRRPEHAKLGKGTVAGGMDAPPTAQQLLEPRYSRSAIRAANPCAERYKVFCDAYASKPDGQRLSWKLNTSGDYTWTLAEIAGLTGEQADADWVRNHVSPEQF